MISQFNTQAVIDTQSASFDAMLKEEEFANGFKKRLAAFMPAKRWYGAKDDEIVDMAFEHVCPLNDAYRTHLCIVRAVLRNAGEQLYQVPVRVAFEERAQEVCDKRADAVIAKICRGNDWGVVYDAAGGENFASAMLELMEKKENLPVANGVTLKTFATEKGRNLIKRNRGAQEKMMGVEQSNTSIVIAKKMMLKIYRRVAVGSHPEVATTSFLTETAGFKNTPAYLGVAELELPDGKPLALAILQEFVANEGDGWNYTLNYLKKFFEAALEQNVAGDYHEEYLKLARRLGVRTAEMHKAFAKGEDAVFAPEPVTARDIADWKAQVAAQEQKTFAAMDANIDNLAGEAKALTKKLAAHRADVTKRLEAMIPADVQAMKTRFHGDYHLGQVVLTQDGDFYLLDFEGEPLKPLMERQVKHCVLKDVAGMVRSFDYAAFGSVLMFVLPEQRAFLTPLVADWQKRATQAFLDGYFETARGLVSLPEDRKTAQGLLDLFCMEKALYEVVYELMNRPDWVSIPVNGVCRLIDLEGENR